MNRRLLLLTLFALGCAATTNYESQSTPLTADIDQFVAQVMRDIPYVPGLGVAIVADGKPLHVRGYGFRDVERREPANADTVFYIASSTKSYLGLAAALLHHRGVIDLDAPITRYLPAVSLKAPLSTERVTLRSLLTHRAGLQNDAIVARTAFTGEHNTADLIRVFNESTPGKDEFRYDNLGYVVAGMAIEAATGKKWQDVLDELLFRPLGMTRTTAYMSRTGSWPVAVPYDINRDLQMSPIRMLKTDATMHAAGGLVSTPRDLARWLEANLNRGRVGGRQVLPATIFDEAHRQQATLQNMAYRFERFGYGLGWYQSRYEGDLMLHHFGGFEGWRAHVSFMPEKRIGVAVVTNTSGFGSLVPDMVAAYIYDRLLGKADLPTKYAGEIENATKRITERSQGIRADYERRRQRPPSLTKSSDAYAGTYANPLYGSMRIAQSDGKLRATIGQLHAELEPFTMPDTARVELVPGSGEVLHFQFADAQSRATALKWRDQTFTRVD